MAAFPIRFATLEKLGAERCEIGGSRTRRLRIFFRDLTFFGSFVFGTPRFPLSDVPRTGNGQRKKEKVT